MIEKILSNMMEKKADFELKYKELENKKSGIFDSPKIKMNKAPTNSKEPERKMTHHKGKSKPAFTHEFKGNSPYNHN